MITSESPALDILSSNADSLSMSKTAWSGLDGAVLPLVLTCIEGANAIEAVTEAAATAILITDRAMVALLLSLSADFPSTTFCLG